MNYGALIGGGALAALMLTACDPPHPHPRPPLKTISTLDCPDTQGDLTRKSAAADGRSCVYASDDGDQVTLQLVSLNGQDTRTALAPIEAQLASEVPVASDDAPTPPPPPGAPPPDKDKVDIDLPGIHIHAHGDGHADVDTAGVHVEAHDGADHHDGGAKVTVGDSGDGHGVHINASDHGARIRIDEGGGGIRARYMLASEHPGPHGYKVAGYDARGPKAGPVVVAVLLSKSDDHDAMHDDIRELLKRNVGG